MIFLNALTDYIIILITCTIFSSIQKIIKVWIHILFQLFQFFFSALHDEVLKNYLFLMFRLLLVSSPVFPYFLWDLLLDIPRSTSINNKKVIT